MRGHSLRIAAWLAVPLFGCVPARSPTTSADWRKEAAVGRWASALRAVECRCDPQHDYTACEDGRRFEAEKAYEELVSRYPIRVRLEVLTAEEIAALTGLAVPDDIDRHAMVVGCRAWLPALPDGLRWRVSGADSLLGTGVTDDPPVYEDHLGGDAEDFVIAFGGQARPSSLKLWKRTGFASVEEYRRQTVSFPLQDQERYGVPLPHDTSSGRAAASSHPALEAGRAIMGAVLLGPALVLGVFDGFHGASNLFGQTSSSPPSREFAKWLEAIKAKRAAENEQWTRDARVATIVKLWHGEWPSPRAAPDLPEEVLVTYGYEVHGERTAWSRPVPAQEKDGDGSERTRTFQLELQPMLGRTDFPPIYVEINIPRRGDLRVDIERFAQTGWHEVTPWQAHGKTARWILNTAP